MSPRQHLHLARLATVNEVMFGVQREDPSIKVLTRILSSDVGMSAIVPLACIGWSFRI